MCRTLPRAHELHSLVRSQGPFASFPPRGPLHFPVRQAKRGVAPPFLRQVAQGTVRGCDFGVSGRARMEHHTFSRSLKRQPCGQRASQKHCHPPVRSRGEGFQVFPHLPMRGGHRRGSWCHHSLSITFTEHLLCASTVLFAGHTALNKKQTS